MCWQKGSCISRALRTGLELYIVCWLIGRKWVWDWNATMVYLNYARLSFLRGSQRVVGIVYSTSHISSHLEVGCVSWWSVVVVTFSHLDNSKRNQSKDGHFTLIFV